MQDDPVKGSWAKFGKGGAVRDFIVPLFEVRPFEDGVEFTRFLGTGFLFGQQNHLLTAAHVLANVEPPAVFAVVDDASSWRVFTLYEAESHPSEDIAIVKVGAPYEGFVWKSPLRLDHSWAGSSLPYFSFGYPEDVTLEIVQNGFAQIRPDLVYTEGYVRRRITNVPLDLIRGSEFLELSTVAGPGCSGSPVIRKNAAGPAWHVIGIYIGERLNDRATSVSYAVRIEAANEWSPDLLGRRLLDQEA